MPTFTLSWADLALFGLTAGLIGGIVLVGRSSSPFNGTTPSIHKNTIQSKKKKKAKKGNTSSRPSPPASLVERHENPKESSSLAQPAVVTPESVPDTPPDSQAQAVEPSQAPAPPHANQSQTAKKKKVSKKAADKINDQEFPPIAATKNETHNAIQNKPKRPFAERHQQPVRKTIVDDMIDEDVQKPLKMARVMNIVGPEPEDPVLAPSDPEDGWEKVPDSKRPRPNGISISIGSASSVPTSSKPKQASEQAPSKRQRQNAKKKEAAKALKAAEEAERLSHLSAHKREQERLRMNAQTRSPQPIATSTKPTGKKVASASIAEDGRLIWE